MIKGLILSIQFLTRIPINIPVDFNSENLRRSTFFFPLVGVMIGGIASLVHYLFSFINLDLASFMTVISIIFLSGGLHLDGLADTFDGFFANKEKDLTLEIMSDSRIGAFGVIGLILLILGKYILISNLGPYIPIALILSLGNSRLILGHKMGYRRIAKESGIGYMFHISGPKTYVAISGLVYMIILILLNPIYLIPLFTTLLLSELMTLITYRKIGGFTGDVYGASVEISELVSLITFLEVVKWI